LPTLPTTSAVTAERSGWFGAKTPGLPYGGRAIHGPCRLGQSEPKPRFGSTATPASGWPVPVLARLRDQIRKPIEELKRRELNDSVGPRRRGFS